MRSRRRVTLLLASAAALGVGLIAFPASSAAAPPVVPNCAVPNTTGSDSCAVLKTNANVAPIGSTLEPIKLGIRVRSVFANTNQETTFVKLQFDEQIALNFNNLPACPPSELTGKNVAEAWEQCGPGADGNPSTEGNAFLSTGLTGTTGCAQGCVSGIGSSIPNGGGAVACTMIFRGADNAHVSVYARAGVPNATTGCDNPASNTGGVTTLVFPGTITHAPTSSIYDNTLIVSNTQTANPPLDDFYATLTRGSVFRARCATRSPSAHRMLATWDYFLNSPPDPNDTYTAVHACPH